jgi:hypothetical protein
MMHASREDARARALAPFERKPLEEWSFMSKIEFGT